MVWIEVETAQNEKRREIVLSGATINERISKDGLDSKIFELSNLNYLNISESVLETVPDDIVKLGNLQTLVLHSNRLEEINVNVCMLDKLKVLDLSNNSINNLPDQFCNLAQLTTLNLSLNRLENVPNLTKTKKLSVLNLSNNKLKEFQSICNEDLKGSLTELRLSGNEIMEIPLEIYLLSSLKLLDLSSNKIKTVPGEIIDCKLKEFLLKNNPVSDRRLLKLIDQCHTKQIMDYIKQHSKRTVEVIPETKKKNQKNSISEGKTEIIVPKIYTILVKHHNEESVNIIVEEQVKSVRPYILACVLHNLKFTEDNFKRFIQLQTKIHDTICDQRNAATIATHDFKKLVNRTLVYTATLANKLQIKPLNCNVFMTGEELYAKLQKEAESLRKEKKRSNYSGIHKYLYLLKGKKEYPCVKVDSDVISFPPITNSDTTKISIETTSLLLEVTSEKTLGICSEVLNRTLKEFINFFNDDLEVEQVKIVDVDGNLRSVYPSRTDLLYGDGANIEVIRE